MTHGLVFRDRNDVLVEDESAYSQGLLERALLTGCIKVERWYNGELIETVAYEVRPLGRVRQ